MSTSKKFDPSDKPDFKPVKKGTVCTIFGDNLKMPRMQHSALGVIHPIYEYKDPRKEIEVPQLEP